MIIKKELLKREIAGESILIPVGKTVIDSHGMYAMNELGSFLWDLLPAAENEESLVNAVLREYEAEEAEVRRDVAEFLDKLREMGII